MREDVIPSKGGRAGGARDLASCGDARLIAEVSSGLMEKNYCVCILTNAGGTVLYVGITSDLPSRVDRHSAGLGGAFTKKSRAGVRSKKEALIRTMNPKLENFAAEAEDALAVTSLRRNISATREVPRPSRTPALARDDIRDVQDSVVT